jgi:FtsZ-interacting cell division protein ZipA
MTTVLIVVGAVLLLLAVGGFIAQRRRMKDTEDDFRAELSKADRDLAAALAEDQGWEYSRLEAAAREAFASANPGREIEQLHLVEVTDRPGKDEDRAAFRVVAGGAPERVEIARRGDDWGAGS